MQLYWQEVLWLLELVPPQQWVETNPAANLSVPRLGLPGCSHPSAIAALLCRSPSPVQSVVCGSGGLLTQIDVFQTKSNHFGFSISAGLTQPGTSCSWYCGAGPGWEGCAVSTYFTICWIKGDGDQGATCFFAQTTGCRLWSRSLNPALLVHQLFSLLTLNYVTWRS